jgi:hypothetical protein
MDARRSVVEASMTDPTLVLANRALLDALDALGKKQSAALVLIGAQAIYRHVGSDRLPVAQYTKDADLAVDPALLAPDPKIESALEGVGFSRTPPPGIKSSQPGQWHRQSDDGWTQVDLLVPEQVVEDLGVGGRRSVRIEPHDKDALTRAAGLEACLVDHEPARISALSPGDDREFELRVAGRAALIVAKAYKMYERSRRDRFDPKDAYDVYRLLRVSDLDVVRRRLVELEADVRCGGVVTTARTYLDELYGDVDAFGPTQTALIEDNAPTAAQTRGQAHGLVRAILGN